MEDGVKAYKGNELAWVEVSVSHFWPVQIDMEKQRRVLEWNRKQFKSVGVDVTEIPNSINIKFMDIPKLEPAKVDAAGAIYCITCKQIEGAALQDDDGKMYWFANYDDLFEAHRLREAGQEWRTKSKIVKRTAKANAVS